MVVASHTIYFAGFGPSIDFFIVAMMLGNGAALPAIASLSSFLFSSSSSFSFANHIGNAMEIYNRIV